MTVDPATSPHRLSHAQKTYYFCSAGCRSKFAADPEKYLHGAAPNRQRAARRRDLHLPDASGNPPDRPGRLPDLRHGARARGGRRGRRRSRTRRHDAPLLDRTLLALPVVVLDMGGHFGLLHLPGRHFDCMRSLCWRRRWCCGPAGRSSCAASQSLVTRNLNMFTLIAMGTGVAYGYSVVATLAPGLFPAAFHDEHGGIARLFRGRQLSSPCWCCSARCWNCARAPRPRARSARCSISRPKPRAASRTTAATRTCRSRPLRSATACACAPAKRCRSTAC